MQALKGLVVGLGLLIVVGAVLLGYGFYVKFHKKDVTLFKESSDAPAAVSAPAVASAPAAVTATSAPVAPSVPGAAFGETRLDLPEGCGVTEMRPAGNRLFLRTGPTGICERIVIIDAATGGVLGTIVVRP